MRQLPLSRKCPLVVWDVSFHLNGVAVTMAHATNNQCTSSLSMLDRQTFLLQQLHVHIISTEIVATCPGFTYEPKSMSQG